eukprot:CAMPEP_0117441544 /NCGR_PEP_ID=MMETSP0759-20121206/3689_1 /TAXON_ID=63605 /ORGANISM="Percolomonas cosmopolitus, Strain WS" /LENGTH=393 /DNA_ID=CAMNT_0005233401 /DNA_START=213 /DNA_END=1394 /DNA_ORIENTATION=+
MADAVSIFSKKTHDGRLPLVLIPQNRSILSLFMKIPDGVHVVMHKFGKFVPNVTPGLKVLPPWFRVAYLVSKQSNAYNSPIAHCPTSDNVETQVDLTLVFRIQDARKFVEHLGALKFDELLKAAIEESTRSLVRSTSHDKVYELRGSRASTFLEELNSKFNDKFGVVFTDATITNVLLPGELATTLQTETTFDSKQKEETKSHQFQLKVLNDKADLAMKTLKAQNDRLAQNEIARKERALIQKEQQEIEAQRQKQLAIIKAEEDAATRKYKAETEFNNAKLQGEKEASEIILRAEGESQATKIQADEYSETQQTRSKAEAKAAESKARALLIEAEAEKAAAAHLKSRREFELQMKRLDVLKKMARSGRVIISGQEGDKFIQALTSSMYEETIA